MSTHILPIDKIDTRVLLSTLWLLVIIHILTADILTMIIPESAAMVVSTSKTSGASIPMLMLFGAVMNELVIIMIILTRVLKRAVNRPVNIIVGFITIAYVWGGAAPYPHYTFIASAETLILALIIAIAWTWMPQKSDSLIHAKCIQGENL